jgi:hypothetical protein
MTAMMMLRGAMTVVREIAAETAAEMEVVETAEEELIERNSSTGCSHH